MVIAAFIADKMSSYIAGGMSAGTAAHFTRGELLAIYKGNHYSRDAFWAMRVTPPPENILIEATRAKYYEALTEILKTHGKAPENVPATKEKSGFEKMAEYARNPA
ncbi:MAG: hypothetical protein LBB81_02280 [Treponema sp.]|jgi:hypothetical protein|nr:hypothetical protein [Treponema sp.]